MTSKITARVVTKHFAHVPTITVTMEEAGPIRDLEFAPLEDEDENREDEKSVEDDIKRKKARVRKFYRRSCS